MAFNAANLTQCSPLNATSGPAFFIYETTDNVATVGASTYFTPFANSVNQALYPFTFSVGDQIQAICSDGSVDLFVSSINPIATTQQTVTIVIGANSVNTAAIQNLAVTAAKIAAATITHTQISGTAAITGGQLSATANIAGTQLAAAANIAGSQLAAAANIAGSQLAAAANIAGSQLAAAAGIVGTQLAANTVALANLATGVKPSSVIKFASQYTTVGGAAAEGIPIVGTLATDLAFVQLVAPGTNAVSVSYAVMTMGNLTVTFSGDPGNNAIINYQITRVAV